MPHRRRSVLALLGTYLLFVCLFLFYPRSTASIGTTGAPPIPFTSAGLPLMFDAFGMREGAFAITDGRVQRNETFSDLLTRHGVASNRIHTIAETSRPMLDDRRMRAGNAYRFYFAPDAPKAPRYFVYAKNAIDFVVLDLSDSLRILEGHREVSVRRQQAGGAIDGSLYVTLQNQDKDPQLAVALSDVFAWQVDFYRIMRGDSFAAVYEEQYIEGESIGVDKVLAARFVHQGRTYTAYRFEHEGRVDYYDADGNGLRRPFLRAPLSYSRISSRYSGNRFHPVLKLYRAHLGTDYAAPVGTPVRATADGVVEEAAYTKNNGRYVKIKHNSTYTTGYLHLSGIADGVKAGAFVKQGDVIGFVGSTGLATGPHLCYRFWRNGTQVDPLREELPDTAEPLPDSLRPEFEKMKADLAPLLP